MEIVIIAALLICVIICLIAVLRTEKSSQEKPQSNNAPCKKRNNIKELQENILDKLAYFVNLEIQNAFEKIESILPSICWNEIRISAEKYTLKHPKEASNFLSGCRKNADNCWALSFANQYAYKLLKSVDFTKKDGTLSYNGFEWFKLFSLTNYFLMAEKQISYDKMIKSEAELMCDLACFAVARRSKNKAIDEDRIYDYYTKHLSNDALYDAETYYQKIWDSIGDSLDTGTDYDFELSPKKRRKINFQTLFNVFDTFYPSHIWQNLKPLADKYYDSDDYFAIDFFRVCKEPDVAELCTAALFVKEYSLNRIDSGEYLNNDKLLNDAGIEYFEAFIFANHLLVIQGALPDFVADDDYGDILVRLLGKTDSRPHSANKICRHYDNIKSQADNKIRYYNLKYQKGLRKNHP